jgi:hypothetical protein
MHRKLRYRLLLFSLLMAVTPMNRLSAQEETGKVRTRLTLSYEKLFNGDKKILVDLSSGSGKKTQKLINTSLTLSVTANDSTKELAEIKTNSEGTAELYIMAGYKLPADKDGFSTFTASYPGDSLNKPGSAELSVKDITIEFEPVIVDSVKTINLLVYESDDTGSKVPVEGMDVIVGVERLYNILQVGQVQTDAEGKGSLEFPNDLPGDSAGVIIVTARIEDNETYGTVGTRQSLKWGIPVSYDIEPWTRQLWSNEAPLWMIFAVFIVLSAAWFHFFLAINRLWKVKKATDMPGTN